MRLPIGIPLDDRGVLERDAVGAFELAEAGHGGLRVVEVIERDDDQLVHRELLALVRSSTYADRAGRALPPAEARLPEVDDHSRRGRAVAGAIDRNHLDRVQDAD